jgi:phage/conjugal plasmid C-4 type zinc finger TraR family protein
MDELDQVQEQIEQFQAFALKQQQQNREPDNNAGIACVDCGYEIPLKRRLLKPGCRRCVDCQGILENWGAL